MAWLAGATDWELLRRRAFLYPLLGPHAAIDDTETEASLVALATRYRTDWRADACLVADFLAPVSTTAAVIVVEPDNAIT